jgi:septal ring factor EnvC (AmiA/AmiB activator)
VSTFTNPNISTIWKNVLATTSITRSNKENLSKELNKELKKIDKELKQIDEVIDAKVDVDNIESLNSKLKPHNIIITDTQICFYIHNQAVVSKPVKSLVKSRPDFITMLNKFMKSDGNSKLEEKITKIYTIIDSNINNLKQLNEELADFNISIIDNEKICINI